jgi:hypothetical protein
MLDTTRVVKMSESKNSKPRKKRSSKKVSDQKVVAVDPTTHEPTVVKPNPYTPPSGKELLPHSLHRQIHELKTKIENLEVLVRSLLQTK